MDPNATLDLIRTLRGAVFAGTADTDDITALAEACENLDTWLSRGGFLPDDWASPRPPAPPAPYIPWDGGSPVGD